MDATTQTCQQDEQPAYTTSKQVQAWFLRRSRDRWKRKHSKLKVESKRLRQRVSDVCSSRDSWRSEAKAAREEAQSCRLRTPLFRLNSSHTQTKLKKKVAGSLALFDDPSFAETPADHGYSSDVPHICP